MLDRGSGDRPYSVGLIERCLPLIGSSNDSLNYAYCLHLEGLGLAIAEISRLNSLALEVYVQIATQLDLQSLAIEEYEYSGIGILVDVSLFEQTACAARSGNGGAVLQQNALPSLAIVVANLPVTGLALHYNAHLGGVTLLALNGKTLAINLDEARYAVLDNSPVVLAVLFVEHNGNGYTVLTSLTGLTVSDFDLLAIGEIDLIAIFALNDFRYIDIVLHSVDQGLYACNVLIQSCDSLFELSYAVFQIVDTVVQVRRVELTRGEEHCDSSHQIEKFFHSVKV